MRLHTRFHLLPVFLSACLLTAEVRASDDPLISLVTEHFDTNSDGQLDTGEWQSGLDDAFDALDSNADNALTKVDLAELKAGFARMMGETAATVVAAAIAKTIDAYDADQNQAVSKDEFVAGSAALFKKLDANSDGTVDAQELLALPTLE